jgi:hypothetical protein
MEDEQAVNGQEGDDDQRATPSEEALPSKSEAVAGHDIVYIFRAYTNREITYEEWVRRTKEWAEQMKRQHKKE